MYNTSNDEQMAAVDGGTTTDIILDDLFYDYIAANTDGAFDSRRLVDSYKEYQTEKTPKRLTPVPRGFFFPYQEQQTRYNLHVNKLFCMNDPGTGKTFAAIMASEMYRGNYDPSLPPDPRIDTLPPVVRQYLMPTRTNIKRTVYLTVNHVLDRQAMATVPIVKNANGITHEDEQWYTSKSYGTFLTDYTKLYYMTLETEMIRKGIITDLVKKGKKPNSATMKLVTPEIEARALSVVADRFREELSDTFFILDEVHTLPGQSMSKIAKGKNINYKLIRLLLKTVERSPIVVFTATPISSDTNEVIPVLNLVLSREMEIPLTTNLDRMSDADLDQLLTERCRDIVFHVSSSPSGINAVYDGIPLPESPFAYVPCEMQGRQLDQYIAAMNRELKNVIGATGRGVEVDKEDIKKDAAHSAESMAALCWAPLAEITASKGRGTVTIREPVSITIPENSPEIKEYAQRQEDAIRGAMGDTSRRVAGEWAANYVGNVREPVDAMPYLFDTRRMAEYGESPENWMINGPAGNNLRQRSSKYYMVLEEMTDPVRGSKVAVGYFRFLVKSGLEAFVAIALLNGYERYDDTLSDVASSERIVGLEKRRRLIVLTPGMKSATIRLWLDIVAHADNTEGDYINLVLISPGMKIGIGVFNTRKIFHMAPDWTPWGEFQAIYRGLREGGVEAILKKRGIYPDGVVDVHIALLAATFPSNIAEIMRQRDIVPKDRAFMRDIRPYSLSIPYSTIDEDMYQLIDFKYRAHIRVIGRMRNLAVTCSLNREWNEESVCAETCDSCTGMYVNSFNVLYTHRHTWALKGYIGRLIKAAREPVHISDIISSTRDYQIPLHVYYRAISEMMEEKTPIVNELGIPLYINFDRERIFLQRDYPVEGSENGSNWLHSYYANFVTITYSVSDEVPEYRLSSAAVTALQSIHDVDELRAHIRANHPAVEQQMVIIETALVDTLNNNGFPDGWRRGKWRTVLDVYFVYWGWFSHPIEGNIVLAHSFVSFWHEAGYPIIARLRNPSRYRYYTGSQKEWRVTHERSKLVDTIRQVYSVDKIASLFSIVTAYPLAIDTICDGQFRVVLSDVTTNRGRMINSLPYLDLAYILVVLYDVPPLDESTKLSSYAIYSDTDMDSYLRDEIELTFPDEATRQEMIELTVEMANLVTAYYTRQALAEYLEEQLNQLNRTIKA